LASGGIKREVSMLKQLTIRNFKAIRDMTIDFTPLTVLIGGNSCGKTTVLQALDFLRSAATRDIPEYLRERGWDFDDLKSQFTDMKKSPIEFITIWEITVNGKSVMIEWLLAVDFQAHWIIKEKIIRRSDEAVILSYHIDDKDFPLFLSNINIQSSAIKSVAGTSKNTDELDCLFQLLSESIYFDAISPEKIRNGLNLSDASNIGIGGSTLAAYIQSMSNEHREKLNKLSSDIVGFLIEIQTITTGKRIELSIKERTLNKTVAISSQHISDGLLRIIAFAAISLEVIDHRGLQNGMILLDEIENGINPFITEKVIGLLQSIISNAGRQVVITTHSPIILNDVDCDDIIFLWKDESSAIRCKKLFAIEELRESLEFLNPGDAWMNIRQEDLMKKLKYTNEGKDDKYAVVL
jgi:predicted ATPase